MIRFKNTNLGRSMLEMLGVLAIIGVLSIAALYGYRLAMDSHHANEILNDVGLAGATVTLKEDVVYDERDYTIDISEFRKTVPYDMSARLPLKEENEEIIVDDTIFAIEVDGVPEGVCKSILNKTQATAYVITMVDENHVTINKDYAHDRDICEESNNMQFWFNLDGQCEIGCPAPKCCYGKCCDPDETCHPITHTCVEIVNPGECEKDYETKCPDDGPCCDLEMGFCCGKNCCPKSAVCCNGQCCERDKCTGDSNTGECCTGDKIAKDGQCVCTTDENGMQLVLENGVCSCPRAEGNVQLERRNGICVCPGNQNYFSRANICCPRGQTAVSGECRNVTPSNGQDVFNCTIQRGGAAGADLCGFNCNANCKECDNGVCYPSECANDEDFVRVPYEGSSYKYACRKRRDDGIYCFFTSRSNATHRKAVCVRDEEVCCSADENLVCTTGSCDNFVCPGGYADANWGLLRACGRGRITCHPTGNKWTCYNNGIKCSNGKITTFSEEEIAATNFCTDKECGYGYTWNSQHSRCERSDGSYCLSKHDNPDVTLGNQSCFDSNGNKICTYQGSTGSVLSGSCNDPGCPTGMTYGPIADQYYGCRDTNGLECYYSSDYRPAICYLNGRKCGSRCTMDGNCTQANLDECSPESCRQNEPIVDRNCNCIGTISQGRCCTGNGNNFFQDNKCINNNCPEEMPYFDRISGDCVSECNPPTVLSTDNTCVLAD